MKNVKALFIDCDGVLYDKKECTDEDITTVGLGKTLAEYNLFLDEFDEIHAKLKKNKIRGFFNAVLALCQRHDIEFAEFAQKLVNNINYRRISKDLELLDLLKKVKLPVYIVTNNTRVHVEKIFAYLKGGVPFKDVQKELGVKFVAIEDTLKDGIFHSKKMENMLTELCAQSGLKPEEVLLLDDSENVYKVALAQGLQAYLISSPKETKEILRGFIA
ncbi:MAG: HAD family hydrolase [Alphaproteobacteria bacterium]|nr:HAD family hydrolase [Alphaproteobacteria bacterium]